MNSNIVPGDDSQGVKMTTNALLYSPANNDRLVVAADLEGTLTAGTTWHALREFLRIRGDERTYRNFFLKRLPGIIRYRLGLGDGEGFKYAWIRDMWALYQGSSGEEVERLAEWVVEEQLWPGRREEVLTELLDYADRGHRIVVVSGVAEPVLAAFVARVEAAHGAAFEAIGSPLQFEGTETGEKIFNGRFDGELNVGKRKAAQLRPFTRDGKIAAAYGDTALDIPMLAMSHRPVAVAPDPRLRQEAVSKGWRIMEATDESTGDA